MPSSPLGRRPPPARAFWELTRRCDHGCLHCQLRAGDPLPDELTRDEALSLADQLAALKVPKVVLTGGEPLLCPWWDEVAARLTGQGVKVRLFTGGRLLTEAVLDRAESVGVRSFAISLDGPAWVHDPLRPVAAAAGIPGWWRKAPASYAAAVSALRRILDRGLDARVVTVVSARTLSTLDATYELLRDLGVKRWQVQLVRAEGRAADHAASLLPPPQALEQVVAVLLRATREGRVHAPLHCSIGYMTEEEAVLRRPHDERRPIWDGASAGLRTLAIDPRGGTRGCVCLPSAFATASIRERSLAELWQDDGNFPYARRWDSRVLAGACASCPLANRCRAGCPGVAYGTTGTIGANPYCLRIVRGG